MECHEEGDDHKSLKEEESNFLNAAAHQAGMKKLKRSLIEVDLILAFFALSKFENRRLT